VRKRIRGRVILLVVITLVSGYYITPSISTVGSLPSLFPGVLPRAERVNLGLDLQGGMHLVLEVQADRAVENAVERMMEEARRLLEKEKIGVTRLSREGKAEILLKVAKAEERAFRGGRRSGSRSLPFGKASKQSEIAWTSSGLRNHTSCRKGIGGSWSSSPESGIPSAPST